MKVLLSVLFVVLCTSTLGSCSLADILAEISSLPSIRNSEPTPSCLGKIGPICNDCKSYLKCMNVDPAPVRVCSEINPNTPYCHNGACVAELPVECQSEFFCSNGGYFPDPLDCKTYHLCAGARATGTTYAKYNCPDGFAYNPTTTMCTLTKECNAVDCTRDPDGIVPYAGDNRYFVYCRPDDVPAMLKCDELFVFKPSSGNCVFQCPREGRIAVPNTVAEYYDCYLNGTTYLYRKSKCILDLVFDQEKEQCV